MDTVIWIDDRSDKMENIVRGTFPILWSKGIYSKVVFLGDAEREVKDNEACIFSNIISDLFWVYYKSYLIENLNDEMKTMSCAYKKENGEHPDDVIVVSSETNNEVSALFNAWKELNEKTEGITDPTIFKTNKYDVSVMFESNETINDPIRSFIPASNEHCVYALDVVLLDGDYKKIKQNIPTLSIAIYNYIVTELKAKCILYSQYTYDSNLENNVNAIYTKLYGSLGEKLRILPRMQYYAGSINENAISALKP